MKHRITLSDDELKALCLRLVPIKPVDYDLKTFSILRNLYGRFTRLLANIPDYPVSPASVAENLTRSKPIKLD